MPIKPIASVNFIAVSYTHLDVYKRQIKSGTLGIQRSEYEYSIPLAEAEELLDTLCEKPLLEKTRHFVRHHGHRWEIDEFTGDNSGLVVAELELKHPDDAFVRPDWLGEEVSHDIRYYNSQLARHPYSTWSCPNLSLIHI